VYPDSGVKWYAGFSLKYSGMVGKNSRRYMW
jgi:hypothetical protein